MPPLSRGGGFLRSKKTEGLNKRTSGASPRPTITHRCLLHRRGGSLCPPENVRGWGMRREQRGPRNELVSFGVVVPRPTVRTWSKSLPLEGKVSAKLTDEVINGTMWASSPTEYAKSVKRDVEGAVPYNTARFLGRRSPFPCLPCQGEVDFCVAKRRRG